MKWEERAIKLATNFDDFLSGHPEIRVTRNRSGRITYLRCSDEVNTLIEVVFSHDKTDVLSLKYITTSGKYITFPEY